LSLVALAGDTVSISVHLCTPTTTCASFIPDVKVGGVGVHYVNGVTEPHTYDDKEDPKCTTLHSPSLEANTSTVYVYDNAGVPRQIATAGGTYTGCGVIGPSTVNYTVYAY
jgi:hypothetical protein